MKELRTSIVIISLLLVSCGGSSSSSGLGSSSSNVQNNEVANTGSLAGGYMFRIVPRMVNDEQGQECLYGTGSVKQSRVTSEYVQYDGALLSQYGYLVDVDFRVDLDTGETYGSLEYDPLSYYAALSGDMYFSGTPREYDDWLGFNCFGSWQIGLSVNDFPTDEQLAGAQCNSLNKDDETLGWNGYAYCTIVPAEPEQELPLNTNDGSVVGDSVEREAQPEPPVIVPYPEIDYSNELASCAVARTRVLAYVEPGMSTSTVRRLVGKPYNVYTFINITYTELTWSYNASTVFGYNAPSLKFRNGTLIDISVGASCPGGTPDTE